MMKLSEFEHFFFNKFIECDFFTGMNSKIQNLMTKKDKLWPKIS